MRRQSVGSEPLFSYVRLEDRIPADHPLRTIRALGQGVGVARRAVCGAVSAHGEAVDRTGDAAAGDVAAGVLLGALGAPVDGADQLQSAASLVRRPVDGRRRLESDGFTHNRDRLLETEVARAFLTTLAESRSPCSTVAGRRPRHARHRQGLRRDRLHRALRARSVTPHIAVQGTVFENVQGPQGGDRPTHAGPRRLRWSARRSAIASKRVSPG